MTHSSITTAQVIPIRLTVNGREQELLVAPHETLIEIIRDRLGLTGTKKSCDVQVCGACTVLLDGRPVSSCTMLAFEARNTSLLTIEGMASGEALHPIQQAFIEHSGFQCGFCTPGMILTTKALLDEKPTPTEDEIKHYLRGNLCRCTGYKRILEAVRAAAQRLQDGRQDGGSDG